MPFPKNKFAKHEKTKEKADRCPVTVRSNSNKINIIFLQRKTFITTTNYVYLIILDDFN